MVYRLPWLLVSNPCLGRRVKVDQATVAELGAPVAMLVMELGYHRHSSILASLQP